MPQCRANSGQQGYRVHSPYMTPSLAFVEFNPLPNSLQSSTLMPVKYIHPDDQASLRADLHQLCKAVRSLASALQEQAEYGNILDTVVQLADRLPGEYNSRHRPSARAIAGEHEPVTPIECIFRFSQPPLPDLPTSNDAGVGDTTADLLKQFKDHPALQPSTGITVSRDPNVDETLIQRLEERISSSTDRDDEADDWLAKWNTLLNTMYDLSQNAELHYESEQVGAARIGLIEAANIYMARQRNFVPPYTPLVCQAPSWSMAQLEKRPLLTDWTLKTDGQTHAILQWKRRSALSDASLEQFARQIRIPTADPLRFWIETRAGASEVVTNRAKLNGPAYEPLRLALLQVSVTELTTG